MDALQTGSTFKRGRWGKRRRWAEPRAADGAAEPEPDSSSSQDAGPLAEPDLSIVVPAFNEETRLRKIFGDFAGYLRQSPESVELLFVDDGSTDGSVEFLERCREEYSLERLRILRNPGNRGKGFSVRRGMLAARGRTVLFSDADLSTPLGEIAKLRSYMPRADVVIGSRSVTGAELVEKQSLYRRLGGKAINLGVQLIAVPGIQDTQCGFKMFTREAARAIFSRCTLDGFSFDVEVLYVARKLGYRIAEVPVVWKNAPGSKVDPIQDGLRLLRDLLVIRANDRRARYEEPIVDSMD